MAANISHLALGLGAGYVFLDRQAPRRFMALSALCAALPDADAIPLYFDIQPDPFWGHRAFTHSFCFALLTAVAVVTLCFPGGKWTWRQRLAMLGYFFAVTASHPLLDLLNQGAEGVALLAPFSMRPCFIPWRPLAAAPLYPRDYFSYWGFRVISGELMLIWLPTGLLVFAAYWKRKRAAAKTGLPT